MSERVKFDFYETPPWQTRALTSRVQIAGRVLEPCVGDRSLAAELKNCQSITTNDIDPQRLADFHLDATKPETWEKFPEVDWVVTNPPFNSAMPILQNSFRCARVGVVMLLRISFMEPTDDRGSWLVKTPPQRQIILPRWSYKQNGKTDSVTTAWYVWLKNYSPIDGAMPRAENL